MADNKRWFKVWSTILSDPHHSGMSLAQVGLWARLGALMVQSGKNGKLTIKPPSQVVLTLFAGTDWESVKGALKLLPNVHIEEGKIDNGEFSVIIRNWSKYQCDSTVYSRIKEFRKRQNDNGLRGEERRGEEKRGEEKRKEEKVHTQAVGAKPAPFIKPGIDEIQEFIRSNQYSVEADRFLAFYESNGWMVGRNRMKNWKAAVRTWNFNPRVGGNGNGKNNGMRGATPVPGKYDHLG